MIRLIPLLILFLLSLLTIFKAPAYYLWLAAIVVAEYPVIFIGLTTIFTVSGVWVNGDCAGYCNITAVSFADCKSLYHCKGLST